MRKSLLAAMIITAALGLSLPQLLLAQGDVDQQLGIAAGEIEALETSFGGEHQGRVIDDCGGRNDLVKVPLALRMTVGVDWLSFSV